VFRAVNLNNGETLAVKQINGRSVASKLEFLKEAKVLQFLNHPYLLRLVAIFVEDEGDTNELGHTNQQLYLVTEYCAGGSLLGLLVDETIPSLSWKTRIRFAFQVAKGLQVLHENNLIHGDLKCENCFLKHINGVNPDREFSHYSIVLGDFGLARWYSSKSWAKNIKMTVRGTPWTMAPELMSPKSTSGYTVECDIFSLGVTLLEIACRTSAREIPRDHALLVDMALVESMPSNPQAKQGIYVSILQALSTKEKRRKSTSHVSWPPEYMSIVRECVGENPASRPTSRSIANALEALLESKS